MIQRSRKDAKDLRCSFCLKTQSEVRDFAVGPGTQGQGKVAICGDCIWACGQLVSADEDEAP